VIGGMSRAKQGILELRQHPTAIRTGKGIELRPPGALNLPVASTKVFFEGNLLIKSQYVKLSIVSTLPAIRKGGFIPIAPNCTRKGGSTKT
jgi:hypothetical protein